MEESNLFTAPSIQAKKCSLWRSKGPSWTISLADQKTFRFAADETEESFEQSLAFIEEHAQIFQLPLGSHAYLRLKDSNKKTVSFTIKKSSISIWDEMKGPPTLQGLAGTLKRVTKPDIPWGLILFALAFVPNPEVEQQGLIQDLDSALLGLSLIGIAVVARKIPQANFFLFQMTWELVFLMSIALDGLSADGNVSEQVVQGVFFTIFLVFFRHRLIQHYKYYKRYSSL